jgi:hypothetical protein
MITVATDPSEDGEEGYKVGDNLLINIRARSGGVIGGETHAASGIVGRLTDVLLCSDRRDGYLRVGDDFFDKTFDAVLEGHGWSGSWESWG